jgi:hypothetical protein
MGHDDDMPLTSSIRAMDIGGLIWAGQAAYLTLDEAFDDLEQGLTDWMQGQDLGPE